jgi:restriction system protein
MNPRQFEIFVEKHFKQKGYKTNLTPQSGDYGVDVFAEKNNEKIAIQAKMFGDSQRKINRKAMMELYGAKEYFDCTKAVMVTNGKILNDAKEVAQKLNIELVYLDYAYQVQDEQQFDKSNFDFYSIWQHYVMLLEGKTLNRENGKSNKIVKVDWSGIKRITSNNKSGFINIEIFKETINKLLSEGYVSREYINQNYPGRASSGVILILSQVPFFKLTNKPTGLKYEI